MPKPGVRRTFSAADKLRIVKEAAACSASGTRGGIEALLRREGIYSSPLCAWRVQLGAYGAAGLVAKAPGRKPKLSEAERRCVELAKRNALLERKCCPAAGSDGDAMRERRGDLQPGLDMPRPVGGPRKVAHHPARAR